MSKTKKVDVKWHAKQVEAYTREQDTYKTYAATLKAILEGAVQLYAPLSIVEAREKTIASFAEKAARKFEKYKDPVHQITDLCGARIIVPTLDQATMLCRVIRDNFVIDELNSDDAGARLKDIEFGYRAVHFVVQLDRKKNRILGVKVPLKTIDDRKAEIQVQTMAQHTWAAITHDRLYKSGFEVPSRLRRLGHRIAALLEDADDELNGFERDMQAYFGDYRVYLEPDKLASELQVAELVLQQEPDQEKKPPLALRVARLAYAGKGKERFQRIVNTLGPFEGTHGPWRPFIIFELGRALVEKHGYPSDDPEFTKGLELLHEVKGATRCDDQEDWQCIIDRKLRATAAAILAKHSKPNDACTFHTEALERDPEDPYILCALLAYNLEHTGQRAIVDSSRPAILRAIDVCRSHVRAGLQIPRAWLTMGRLHLVLGQDAAALDVTARPFGFICPAPLHSGSKQNSMTRSSISSAFRDEATTCRPKSNGPSNSFAWASGSRTTEKDRSNRPPIARRSTRSSAPRRGSSLSPGAPTRRSRTR